MTDSTDPGAVTPIEFMHGPFRCKLVSQPYAELAGARDATEADLIAALLAAEPERRMRVMMAMPDKSLAVEERRRAVAAESALTAMTARAEAAEGVREELEQRLARVAELAHDRDDDSHEKRSRRLGQCAGLTWNAVAAYREKDGIDRGVLKWTPLAKQLADSEARAEAAEAELDSWKLEARSLAADVVRCWEHGRLGSRDHAMYNAAKRIKDSSDGAHVARDQTTTPVETVAGNLGNGRAAEVAPLLGQDVPGPGGSVPDAGSTGSGGEVSKDVIVDGKPDGAPGNPGGSQDGVAPTAQQPGHLSTGDPPPEPAPAGFSFCGTREFLPKEFWDRHRCANCGVPAVAVRRNTLVGGGHRRNVYWCAEHDDDRATVADPAPQSAAAPEVVPPCTCGNGGFAPSSEHRRSCPRNPSYDVTPVYDEPEPAGFAVGQQVWPSMTAPQHCYNGADGGEVISVGGKDPSELPYRVRWSNGSDCNYAQHELTSAPPAPQPAAAPKVETDHLDYALQEWDSMERDTNPPKLARTIGHILDYLKADRLERGGEGKGG